MTYSTRLQLRTRLNIDLGLADDTATKPWGDEVSRNEAIRDGFERMWPTMRRLGQEPDIDYANGQQEYDLTVLRDVQLIEVKGQDGIVRDELSNWRHWTVNGDPNISRLRLATGASYTGAALVVTGTAPYFSQFVDDTTECDLEQAWEYIPLLGAKSWLYRNRYHEFLDFEHHYNENRDNAITPEVLYQAYQDMEGRFQGALQEHSYQISLPRRAKMTRGK